MATIDIEALARQFSGKKFGELVLEHRRQQPPEQLLAAIQGTMEPMPPGIQPHVEGMLDRANTLAPKKDFWADDCGRVLLFICSMIDEELIASGLKADQNTLFGMFNVVVMNFAYSSHRDPRLAVFIEKAVGKRGFFSRLFC